MKNSQKVYDVIIIGGGAAGIMAAISSKKHHPEYSILIIDRTFMLGRKILVSGAGRCNLTNINIKDYYKDHYYCDNPELLQSVFSKFGYKELMLFFKELGIETYVETKSNVGKVFPVTDSAKNVVSILEDELKRLGINVLLNTEIVDISKQNEEFIINSNSPKSFNCKKLIVSVGGMTYPALGSDGSLYKALEKLGHTIIKPVPTAVPLVSANRLSHLLQGVKQSLEVTSYIDNKKIRSDINDVIFTQYGLSGSAILNISREISIQINRKNGKKTKVLLNFFPGKNETSALEYMDIIWQKRPDQSLERSFMGIFPVKVITALLEVLGLNKYLQVKNLTKQQKFSMLNTMCNYEYDISATRGWNEAEFTAGGIDTKEINTVTLESKIVKQLYLCGEVLNVEGDIGGYNITWAFCSGYICGKCL